MEEMYYKPYVLGIVMWCHGTKEKEWKDSGWMYNGKFYPCEYTDDPNGKDKIIGRQLLELEQKHKEETKNST